MADAAPEEVKARFEELSVLEAEFDDAELELIRKSNELNTPLWKKRAEVIAKIPHFWTLVFEQAPTEFDSFILPSDAQIFAECFETLEVTRFEIDNPKGSPRSVSIKFGFGDNEYFEDKVLEKKFWFRKTKDWEGLVSEPVRINWKKGKDPTEGFTEAAFKLFEAKKKNGSSKSKHSDLPEYKQLVKMIEESTEASPSFFAWFAFVSDYRWVSPEESEQTEKEDAERLAKMKRGEKVDDDEDEEDDETDYQETEVYPQGGEIATLIAEDLWPSAIKYYKSSHEQDDEDLSDLDVEDMDEDEDESGDEIDIRGLVGKGRAGSPPNKKQRKA
ncbi:hypothetical protein GRF29_213g376415 [Pseudopithomyces chartarum]|uniref:Uncharacterized protein n=1 Tax=Pseudopithomyces chartarum TaxID=1892770 RepID=A0AAN6RBC6_9PLEO|nr:hypothetical protein GRF29_213g376415 [Pseudopithomyces chartarum]